jgi:hypothetical protein
MALHDLTAKSRRMLTPTADRQHNAELALRNLNDALDGAMASAIKLNRALADEGRALAECLDAANQMNARRAIALTA